MKTNKKYFYGIKPFEFIWHGEWADPEIFYKGHFYNYSVLEDSLWNMFQEECPDKTEDEFPKWLKKHKYLIEESIQAMMRFEVYDNKNLYFLCQSVMAIKLNASKHFNNQNNSIDRMTIVDRKTGNVFNVCRINKKYPNGEIYRGKWNF